LIISEFRVRGPNGANDEFIEIYNDNDSDHTVTAISGTGYAIAASDGVVRCNHPKRYVIPARGHWLCTNSVGYSLAAYPSNTKHSHRRLNLHDGYSGQRRDRALQHTLWRQFLAPNRFDAVGSTSEGEHVYKEGTAIGFDAVLDRLRVCA